MDAALAESLTPDESERVGSISGSRTGWRRLSQTRTLIRGGVCLLAFAVIVVSCGGSSDRGGSGPFPLTESDLAAAEAYFSPIDAEEDGFAELRSGGDTSEAAVRRFVEAVYSPDIIFQDNALGDFQVGHENVVAMFRTFLVTLGDAVVEDRPTLVGYPTALQVTPTWDVKLGAAGPAFAENSPLVEVDLVEIDDDRIGSLLLFYDLASMRAVYGDLPEFNGALQQGYVEAWGSGSPEAIAALYADDAVRHDGLAGLDASGVEEITAEADRWATALPNATWTVQLPFGDLIGHQVGAVIEVAHDGCTVAVGVLFDLNSDGLISQERLHYDPNTLRTCGWVD